MGKSKMTAEQMVRKLTDIQNQIDALLFDNVSSDDPRIVRLQAEYDRIDAMEPSDSVQWNGEAEDIIIM